METHTLGHLSLCPQQAGEPGVSQEGYNQACEARDSGLATLFQRPEFLCGLNVELWANS